MDFSRKGFESIDYSLQQGLIGITLVFLTIFLFWGAWILSTPPVEGLDSDSVTAGH